MEKRKFYDEITSDSDDESIPSSRNKVSDWLNTHEQQNPVHDTWKIRHATSFSK